MIAQEYRKVFIDFEVLVEYFVFLPNRKAQYRFTASVPYGDTLEKHCEKWMKTLHGSHAITDVKVKHKKLIEVFFRR